MTIGRFLDEHHGWQIIKVPVCRYLDDTGVLALLEWFHPMLCFLRIVDFGPRVRYSEPVSLAVMVAHRMIIFDPVFKEKCSAFLANFPPWRNDSSWRLSTAKFG